MTTVRVAIVTGASSGLGAEMVRQLAAKGWSLGLLARRADRLAALAEEVAPARVCAAPCDVTQRDEVEAAVKLVEATLGPTDLLIANAGVGLGAPLPHERIEDFEQMFRVNVNGAYYSVRAVLPGMLARKRGHVVGISSLAALRGMPGSAAYCATKAALSSWLEGIRIELRPHGIHVTTIQPGFVRSEITDKNDFDMPFFLETAPAVKRMLRAVARRKKTYDVPRRASLVMRMLRVMPDAILRRVAARGMLPPADES